MLKIKIQRKRVSRPEGGMAIRVNHLEHGNRKKKSAPCYRIRCGCCDEKFDIYYFEDGDESLGIEIGGVIGSLENWREILLPILRIEYKDGEFVDVSKSAKKALTALRRLRKKYPR